MDEKSPVLAPVVGLPATPTAAAPALIQAVAPRHGASDFRGSRPSVSAGFGYMRGLLGIFRPDCRNQA